MTKRRWCLWLSLVLLSLLSNLLMNTASSIKIYFQKSEVLSALNICIWELFLISFIKTLPAIAKEVGLENEQALHHFLSQSPWKVEEIRLRRLKLILTILESREIILLIDETGDRKKGKKTDYVKRQYIGNSEIEKWWEVVMSAYLLISLASEVLQPTEKALSLSANSIVKKFPLHRQWDQGKGWKNLLNNFRLILQPFYCFNRLKDWLTILPIPQLSLGFPRLITLINFLTHPISELMVQEDFYHSSA